ncbi:MAG: phosphoribosylamine--glycine ligase [Candidatus Muirbacterium halophilum]|nr:phosphoribosylamine--glycine ligase [Candidatus Muirbacterium halophilum]MCK9477043.1 phosphoribosylamine--glycine ligase [Candidatus Muirbacterium halophilum]
MNVLVIGRGGREHAIVWKLAQSPIVEKVFCATGNAGMCPHAECIDIKAEDVDELLKFAKRNKVAFTVVGPEISLTEGIVDRFEENGLKIFGPKKNTAQLEGSKAYAKKIMGKYKIPTARFGTFEDQDAAFKYIEDVGAPLAIKTDGLSAGKGFIIAKDEITAKLAVNVMMQDKVFGDAGKSIVIEELLSGDEVTITFFTNGEKMWGLVSAQDYKRAYDMNRGPNTHGMGAISPAPIWNDKIEADVKKFVINPFLKALKKEKLDIKGVVYMTLILTDEGPKVVELNVRFGDPESQVVLPRLKNDLAEVIKKILDDDTDDLKIEYESKAICSQIVSGGYPLKYITGRLITGIEKIKQSKDLTLFHSGTVLQNERFYTNGGRVLCLTVKNDDVSKARKILYDNISKIFFREMHYRNDIGLDIAPVKGGEN